MGLALRGVSTLTASLKGMSQRKRDKLREAVAKAGRMQAQALRRSARAKGLGRVAREITTAVRVRGDRVTATTGIRRVKRPEKGKLDPATLGIVADVGTAERKTRKGTSRGAMPANDWIAPAVRETADAIRNDLANAVRS